MSLRATIVPSARRRCLSDRAAHVAQIDAGSRDEPLARAEEVDPAHLEAGSDVPEAVEDRPMTLVAR